jgi:ABC-type nitrate/sulfonate/bicarbonate transport system ATPase subunit
MITIDAASQTFKGRSGPVHALSDINLTVANGEFMAIIGRSGCGKSTLLRMIAGLIRPTGGEVRVAGDRVVGPRPCCPGARCGTTCYCRWRSSAGAAATIANGRTGCWR